MKVYEVTDPTMKLRLEVSKLRMDMEEKDQLVGKLARDVARLQLTVAKLIQTLGVGL